MLMTAILFGGMVLYSFGFAAFLFSHLPAQEAGSILRKAFPVFYLWCIAVALLQRDYCSLWIRSLPG